MRIPESTRRDIIDVIRAGNIRWYGRLDELGFLARLFNLERLPSNDFRFSNAYGDIWQHRVNNDDWSDDWVFQDNRFDLLHGEDDVFLRFLCEMLHPAVRRDPDEVEGLLQEFNRHLRPAGVEIVERTSLAGRPVYGARSLPDASEVLVEPLREAFETREADNILRQIARMEAAVEGEPDLAIGTAKEFVESTCKTILRERGQGLDAGWTLPRLVKETCRTLALVPDSIPEAARGAEVIRKVLGSLATVTHGIAELRGLYGTGHGKEAGAKGLGPRHARLAVGAASTLAIFLLRTHEARPAHSAS